MAAFLYFAYGSNMLTSRLRERCPTAHPVGLATLSGHALKWHKRSKKDGSGKCDIVSTDVSGIGVLGVLYEIPLDEIGLLDRAEAGYNRKKIEVVHLGVPRPAVAYFAIKTDPSLKPYTWYRGLVIAGAREHSLPAPYVARLESVEAIEDPDQQRHAEALRIIERTSHQ